MSEEKARLAAALSNVFEHVVEMTDAIEALIDARIAAREQCEYAPEGHGRCGLAAGHDGMHVQEWAKAEPTAGGQRRDLEALGYERHVYDHTNMGQHVTERCCEPQPSAEDEDIAARQWVRASEEGAAKTEPPAVVHVETINPQLYLEKGLLRDPDRYVPSPDGALIIAWRTGEREMVECELDVKQLQEALAQLPEVMAGELNATAPADELCSDPHGRWCSKCGINFLPATAPAEGGRDTERLDWLQSRLAKCDRISLRGSKGWVSLIWDGETQTEDDLRTAIDSARAAEGK